jgi:hypothetical protein
MHMVNGLARATIKKSPAFGRTPFAIRVSSQDLNLLNRVLLDLAKANS